VGPIYAIGGGGTPRGVFFGEWGGGLFSPDITGGTFVRRGGGYFTETVRIVVSFGWVNMYRARWPARQSGGSGVGGVHDTVFRYVSRIMAMRGAVMP
jgi:hypothetical protein